MSLYSITFPAFFAGACEGPAAAYVAGTVEAACFAGAANFAAAGGLLAAAPGTFFAGGVAG